MKLLLFVLAIVLLLVPPVCAETLYRGIEKSAGEMSVATIEDEPGVYAWNMPNFKCLGSFVGNSLLQVTCESGERIFVYMESEVVVVGCKDMLVKYPLCATISRMYLAAFKHKNRK